MIQLSEFQRSLVRNLVFATILLTATCSYGASLQFPSSAAICGRCHRAIYEAWKVSAHARSMESTVFQDALALAEGDFGPNGRRTCLGCHAPLSAETGDPALRTQVSWEGVTCDYCHSIRRVAASGDSATALLDYSGAKSGPSKDSVSTAHTTMFSEVHLSSEACMVCHEYRNSLGFPVLTTYSEWKSSRAGKDGKQCQTCHMYLVQGNVVDPRIQRAGGSSVNLHQMPGSHTLEQLTRTIKADLQARHEEGRVRASVDLTNRTAGHYVPTGSPLRRLVLEVKVDSYDGQHFRTERVYQRIVADRNGAVVDGEHLAFFKAAKVVSDTRLAPDESRTEEFEFAVPAGVQAQVTATLWYFYSPDPRTGVQKRVTFSSLSRLVR